MNTRSKCSPPFLLPLPLLAGFLLLSLRAASANRSSDAYSMTCDASLADCMEEEEMLMESEISRRFLAETQKHIGYGALARDQPACGGSSGGQSYNCLPPSSNPHNRGCSKYYRCRDGS